MTNNIIENLPAFETVVQHNNNSNPTLPLELYLMNSNVISFPSQAFSAFSTLTILRLDQNKISSVPGNSFPVSLTTLHLDHNYIHQIHYHAFHNLPNLKKLYLSDNKIRHLPAALFATVGSNDSSYHLYLDLSNNDLCTLDADVFLDSPKFTKLSFDNNKISCLPPNVFAETAAFEIILTNNEMTAISPEILALNVLQSENVPNYHYYYSYGDHWYWFILSLKGNQITYIPADILSHIKNGVVDELDLSFNLISYIHPDAFSDYVPEVLNLKNNQLTCLVEGVFLMVSPSDQNSVDLQNNQLGVVHPFAFFGTELSYPARFERQIHDHLFSSLYGNQISIYLDSNLLESDCKMHCWLKHAEIHFVSINCQDNIDWDTWDGLDSNGQCVIPPAQFCFPPSSIPVAPNQCPSCSGKWKLC